MDETLWSRLTGADQDRVDRLIAHGRMIPAIRAVSDAFTPRPPLRDCHELVLHRLAALQEELRRDPTPANDLPALLARVAALPAPPAAIEARWRGERPAPDVLLVAALHGPLGEAPLTLVRHRDNLAGSTGRVPPWPAADAADRLGTGLADHLGVPFRFPGPDHPDRVQRPASRPGTGPGSGLAEAESVAGARPGEEAVVQVRDAVRVEPGQLLRGLGHQPSEMEQ
ncbi:hypothetical protein [Micromonospora sp. NPDC005299]|uniref:hypothetical protein n=1 Tax=Micromonospora sp. NPDC005299 TaxID=3364231 RepID=UPI0036B3CB96